MEQFQLEAAVRNRRTLPDAFASHDTLPDDTLRPRILELLFGLSMRGWLCDQEKELLDSLVDEQEITFLLSDGNCLHPEGVPPLPIDQIESAHRGCGDAVFAQRHIVEHGRERTSFKVRTARLGTINGHDMIFGLLGRDGRDGQRRIDACFATVVSHFRQASNSLQELLQTIQTGNTGERPALFVNRSSGRIIALNQSAREQLPLDEAALIGMEFGQVRDRLADAIAHSMLKITNVRGGGLELGIVSIIPETEAVAAKSLPAPGPGFVQTIRNKISSISASARHLESILGRDPGNTVSELVRIILEETADLDRHAWRQQLLAEYPALPKMAASPVAELKAAVDLVSSSRNQCRIMLFEDTTDGCRVNCPRSSLLLLFEAVLRSHLTANNDQLESRITVRCTQPGGSASVIVQTTHHDEATVLQFQPDWQQYTDRLASVMEIEVNHSTETADNSLQTLITLK